MRKEEKGRKRDRKEKEGKSGRRKKGREEGKKLRMNYFSFLLFSLNQEK